MGYESRIYVVSHRNGNDYCETLAVFDMCVCEREFHEVFTDKIDFDVWFDGDKHGRIDCYGAVCTSAHVDAVAECLRKLVDKTGYRRYKMLLGFLEAFDENDWDNEILLVHFGY